MAARLKSLLTHRFITGLLYRMVRVYCLTFRFTVENEEAWIAYLKVGGEGPALRLASAVFRAHQAL